MLVNNYVILSYFSLYCALFKIITILHLWQKFTCTKKIPIKSLFYIAFA